METEDTNKEIKEINKQFEEVLKEGITREPGYIYYLNKEGNIARKKKAGLKHSKRTKEKKYSEINLTIPTILTKGYILDSTVRKFGKGAMIHLPSRFIGKSFRILLVPESELEENTVNLF